MAPVRLRGVDQPLPTPDPTYFMVECRWTKSFILTTSNRSDPTDWVSGVYVAKITASSGKDRYIIFVVRDDNRASSLVYQQSVNTYQAYNSWGGEPLFSSSPRAVKVSFNRPYFQGGGTGHFLSYEFDMVAFLEREGYDVSYTTDVDTHERGNLLIHHKGFLSVGHDEYWSRRMRRNVAAARNAGVGLGFFSANTMYWQIRYEPSPITGVSRPHHRWLQRDRESGRPCGFESRVVPPDYYSIQGSPQQSARPSGRFADRSHVHPWRAS